MATDILITGRLVGGHPMIANERKDDHGQVRRKPDGTAVTSTFIAVAIPKTPGVPWQNEPWGQVFMKEAQECWTLGEWQHPTFAWKITDGDSTIPKKPFGGKPGRIPSQCEGYPGHWVISCSTEWTIKCYHLNHYAPHEQIQNQQEIKCGDYCRVNINVKGNKPSQSPGLYVNPTLFELSRAGQQIVTGDGPDAATAFGGSAPVLPPNGAYDTGVAAPPPSAVLEPRYMLNGVEYTVTQLKAARYTDAQIATLPQVGAPPPSAPVPSAPPPSAPVPSAPPPSGPAMDFVAGPQPGGLGAPPPAPPAPPAPVEDYYSVQGQVYSKSQLLGFGWTEAQIAACQRSTGPDVPF